MNVKNNVAGTVHALFVNINIQWWKFPMIYIHYMYVNNRMVFFIIFEMFQISYWTYKCTQIVELISQQNEFRVAVILTFQLHKLWHRFLIIMTLKDKGARHSIQENEYWNTRFHLFLVNFSSWSIDHWTLVGFFLSTIVCSIVP